MVGPSHMTDGGKSEGRQSAALGHKKSQLKSRMKGINQLLRLLQEAQILAGRMRWHPSFNRLPGGGREEASVSCLGAWEPPTESGQASGHPSSYLTTARAMKGVRLSMKVTRLCWFPSSRVYLASSARGTSLISESDTQILWKKVCYFIPSLHLADSCHLWNPYPVRHRVHTPLFYALDTYSSSHYSSSLALWNWALRFSSILSSYRYLYDYFDYIYVPS